MNQKPTYADLEIRILEKRDEGYPVDITLNSEQHWRGYLMPDFLPWEPSASPAEDGERGTLPLHKATRTVLRQFLLGANREKFGKDEGDPTRISAVAAVVLPRVPT